MALFIPTTPLRLRLLPPARLHPPCRATRPSQYRVPLRMRATDALTEKLLSSALSRGASRASAEKTISCARAAARDWRCVVSDFLSPPDAAALVTTLSAVPQLRVAAWGGYHDAERTAVVCAHEELVGDDGGVVEMVQEEFVLLRVHGEFGGAKVSHRDVMGAFLNAGVSRAKIGDILLGDGDGAQVVAHADVAAFLQAHVVSVRDVKVSVQMRPMVEISVPEKRVKHLQTVEASMRLDAVVSAGFGLSRSKLAAMAKSGLVFLNYKEVKGPAKVVKTGDVVSVRGVGKLKIGEVSMTAKGRYRVAMEKYV